MATVKTINGYNIGGSYTTFNVGASDTWTSDSTTGGVYHDYTVSGVTADSTPILSPVLASKTNYTTILEQWSKIFRATTAANKIRLYATEAVTAAITIAVKGY